MNKLFIVFIAFMLSLSVNASAFFTPDGNTPDKDGITFEGTTADDYEADVTLLTDPTSDVTIKIPSLASANVVVSSLVTNDISVANSAWFETGSVLALEGATADASETRITTQDPTADVTVTVPTGAFKVGFSMYGTEAQAPTCAAAIGGAIYVASNSTDADDCTMSSGTGTAHNVCICDGSSTWTDAD
jgi:hypothetical protein